MSDKSDLLDLFEEQLWVHVHALELDASARLVMVEALRNVADDLEEADTQ